MEGYAREILGIEHYWGCFEFAGGRGQIHLHILGIARNMGYLKDFYQEKRKEKSQNFGKVCNRSAWNDSGHQSE